MPKSRPPKVKPSEERLYRLEKVAEIFDVDVWTIRNWLDEGKFNWMEGGKRKGAFKLGASRTHPWRIPQSAIDRFIEERQKERDQANQT